MIRTTKIVTLITLILMKKTANLNLYNYYKRLIELRKSEKALRNSSSQAIEFKVYQDPLHITFSIDGESTDSPYTYFISINCNRNESHEIILPEGKWELVLTEELVPRKCLLNTVIWFPIPPE